MNPLRDTYSAFEVPLVRIAPGLVFGTKKAAMEPGFSVFSGFSGSFFFSSGFCFVSGFFSGAFGKFFEKFVNFFDLKSFFLFCYNLCFDFLFGGLRLDLFLEIWRLRISLKHFILLWRTFGSGFFGSTFGAGGAFRFWFFLVSPENSKIKLV